MVWMGASVLVVLLVVSLRSRTFVCGAICGLGVAGLVFSLYHQHTTPEQARERHARARTGEGAPGAGTGAATSGKPRAGTPGTPAAPTAQVWPEAVSTPEEAAQAVQRLRAAHDVLRQGQGEQAVSAVSQAAVRPPSATTVSSPARPSALSSEDDARALAGTPTGSATLTPRVTPIPRVTVMPPSSTPPRAILTPSAVPTSAVTLTPPVTPTPSAPTSGSALKSCDELKAEIQAKLEAKKASPAMR